MNISDNSWPRDLSIEISNREKYDILINDKSLPFYQTKAPMKTVFLFSMALGFDKNLSLPIDKKHKPIPISTFNDDELWLLNSIALSQHNKSDPDILKSIIEEHKVVKICEEYANGGFVELYSLIKNCKMSNEDTFSSLESLIIDIVENI